MTVVTAEEIERYGYRTIDAVLRSVRSFYATNDRNYAYAGMRGFGRPGDYNNRILLLIDGHAVNDNVFGSAPLGTEMGSIDLRTVERIEIVRGPGSSLYGANAMLAVINVVSRDPKSMSPAQTPREILCLHLCGNLQHLIGAVLGNSGYVRNRDAEFRRKDIPISELVAEIELTIKVVEKTLKNLPEGILEKTYPINVFGYEMTTEFFLTHLTTHLNYHLGQTNYHRRLLDF